MGTLHCILLNGADLFVNKHLRYDTFMLGLLKKEECQNAIFTWYGVYIYQC